MGRKQPVDDLTALREATTEAHHAVQSLKDAGKEAREAKAELEQARDSIREMAEAMWDARLAASAEEMVSQFGEATQKAISVAIGDLGQHFQDILMVILGDKMPDEIDPKTAIEQLIVERVEKFGPWEVHMGQMGLPK